jgi:hypothetical protein
MRLKATLCFSLAPFRVELPQPPKHIGASSPFAPASTSSSHCEELFGTSVGCRVFGWSFLQPMLLFRPRVAAALVLTCAMCDRIGRAAALDNGH